MTNKKLEKFVEKITSISMILLVIMTTFSFSFMLSTENVAAQAQEGCCLDTGPSSNKHCVTTTRAECQGRFYTGPPYDCSNVPDCKPQTCIPKDKSEPCMRNKAAAECIALGGVPDSRALEEIPQCKPGCCIIAKGVKAEVLQFRQCENLTLALGYQPEMMEFKEGIISEIECKKQGSPSDLGCCVLGGGDCKYGTRAECTEGNFVPLEGGSFCRDVQGCALTTHNYKDCGKLPGTETDIYWFDSQGNQEELVESCNYPLKICQKNELGIPYCKDTSCNLSAALGSQNMSSTPPKVSVVKFPTKSLLTGTSICYNFYTHYDGSDDGDEASDYLQRRSTGLQNQIIHCSFGKAEIKTLGTDRQRLCVPANASVQGPGATFHANVKDNKWQNCSQCGKGGALDFLGDFFGPFPPVGKGLNALFGKYCTKEICENYGDCVYMEKAPSLLVTAPVASCVPKYPPGTSALNNSATECSKCGNGVGDLWNLCSKEECIALGDCQFKGYDIYSIPMWVLLAYSSFIVGRIVWIPIDCLIAGPTVYAKLGGIPACYRVRYNSWWFKSITYPYKLISWTAKNPLASITTIMTTASMFMGFFKK